MNIEIKPTVGAAHTILHSCGHVIKGFHYTQKTGAPFFTEEREKELCWACFSKTPERQKHLADEKAKFEKWQAAQPRSY